MDIHCPKCAEPVDNDILHDVVEECGSTYSAIAARFRTEGCRAIGYDCNPATLNSFRAQVSSAMFDLMGDDMDGASAMMEDFDYFGML